MSNSASLRLVGVARFELACRKKEKPAKALNHSAILPRTWSDNLLIFVLLNPNNKKYERFYSR